MTIMRETSRPHRGKQHDHTAEKTLNTNTGAPGDHATSQADVDDARYVYGQIPGL